jgi:hypothetical protein
MKQLELFDTRDDVQYALSLTMFELRNICRNNRRAFDYFHTIRTNERERINYQVARAMFIAKLEGNEFSKLSRHVLMP